jgi:hypothetical protein
MSMLTCTRRRLMIKFVFPPSTSNPGQTCKMRITPPEAAPVETEDAIHTLRTPLRGDRGQTAWAQGV